GLFADGVLRGDLFIRKAGYYRFNDFQLTRGKSEGLFGVLTAAAARCREQIGSQNLDQIRHAVLAYPELAVRYCTNTFEKNVGGRILQHDAPGTQLQGLSDLLFFDGG